MSSFLDTALEGTTLQVDLAGLPSAKFNLTGSLQGPSNPVMMALKPRITLQRNGTVLFQQAPYGNPEEGFPFGALAIVALAMVAYIFLK
jgi:hypothetical protein